MTNEKKRDECECEDEDGRPYYVLTVYSLRKVYVMLSFRRRKYRL